MMKKHIAVRASRRVAFTRQRAAEKLENFKKEVSVRIARVLDAPNLANLTDLENAFDLWHPEEYDGNPRYADILKEGLRYTSIAAKTLETFNCPGF